MQKQDGKVLGHGFVSRQAKAETAISTGLKAKALTSTFAAKPGGQKGAGFFDRMFPDLSPLTVLDDALEQLAVAMKDSSPDNTNLDNPEVPAGFTYLGQFIDHDITLDLSSLREKDQDPTMVKNFRTPGLDLDSVYGTGPGPFRFLFARQSAGSFADTPKLLVGKNSPSPDENQVTIPAKDNDLPRNAHGAAIIGDHRNDENLLVAQTHLALLKFHNKVVDHLQANGTAADDLFNEASKLVRWHYQWMVLHDFVGRLTEPGIVDKIIHDGRKFYRFKAKPFMPVEFSAAAYRFGHSMVREQYSHNRVFRPTKPNLAQATLGTLFRFSGLSGQIVGDLAQSGGGPLPAKILPSNWIIDWRRFFDFGVPNGGNFELNHSRMLDPFLTPALHALPGFPAGRESNLAFRNLRRGVILGLPSGQAVADHMRKKVKFDPLTSDEIATGSDGAAAKAVGLHRKTPLWYYLLKEAQMRGGGKRLGPVGSRIVAEVFVGMVQGDETSYLSQKNWKPSLPSKVQGTFLMTDLLNFVGELSPIDGVSKL